MQNDNRTVFLNPEDAPDEIDMFMARFQTKWVELSLESILSLEFKPVKQA